MFSRTVSVVAPAAASPSRPTSCMNTWNTSTSRNTCTPAGPPYFISRPNSSRSGRQPRQGVELARGTSAAAGAPTASKRRRPRPGHGRPARPRDPHLREPGPAEDQDQGQGDVHRGPRRLDPEHRPGLPAAGEEPVDRGHDQHRQRREAEAAQVGHLQLLQGRGVPAERDQVRGGRDHQQESEPGDDGEVDPLPDRRPDPLRAAGPGVLGDERGDVAGGHLEQRRPACFSTQLVLAPRDQEYQADTLGLRYLVAAGYDPAGAAGVLAALTRQSYWACRRWCRVAPTARRPNGQVRTR